MHGVLLVSATFLASAVEMVEALTIVLAVGLTRGWPSTSGGVLAAVLSLTVIVVALGPAVASIPIGALRLLVGALLLVFGLQWLRKAILRASGYVPLRDEDAAFSREVAVARSATRTMNPGVDWYAFTLSFKGVLLEGLEVAFIVVTFGSVPGAFPPVVAGAAAAAVLVAGAGILLHRPLSTVPENTMKFTVGLLLTTFGTFWGGEGAGVEWPGSDGAILGILALFLGMSLALAAFLRSQRRRTSGAPAWHGGVR